VLGSTELALKLSVLRMAIGMLPFDLGLMLFEELPGLISMVTSRGNGPGHVSVTTTIRYLGLKDENLREAAEILAAKYRPPVENDSDCDATGKRYLLSDDPSERESGKHILSQAVAYVRRLTAETG
jgi:hypothetical protein